MPSGRKERAHVRNAYLCPYPAELPVGTRLWHSNQSQQSEDAAAELQAARNAGRVVCSLPTHSHKNGVTKMVVELAIFWQSLGTPNTENNKTTTTAGRSRPHATLRSPESPKKQQPSRAALADWRPKEAIQQILPGARPLGLHWIEMSTSTNPGAVSVGNAHDPTQKV